jgi:nitronate monooxygenase
MRTCLPGRSAGGTLRRNAAATLRYRITNRRGDLFLRPCIRDYITTGAGRPRSRTCPSDRSRRVARGARAHVRPTGTFSLVPQIADMVNVPVIAAGGIADARGVIAALALGAEAVQMGTVFLACEESGASLLHRQTLRGKKAGHTALTRGFTGRLARAIHNRLLEELNQEGTAILPYPLQRRLVRNLAIPAEAAGRSDLLPLWAGQSANLSTCTDVLAFLTSLVEEVSEIAGPIIRWSSARREKQILK